MDVAEVLRQLQAEREARESMEARLTAIESGVHPAQTQTFGAGRGDTRLYLRTAYAAGGINGPHIRADGSDPALAGTLWICPDNDTRYSVIPVFNLTLTPAGGTWPAETDFYIDHDDLIQSTILLVIRGLLKKPGWGFTYDNTTGPRPFVTLATAPYKAGGMDVIDATTECYIAAAWRGSV